LSNYVTTRPKGSDVASRYHKSEKQHLTKREERERQKRQLFQERQELAKRDEENDSDTYSTKKKSDSGTNCDSKTNWPRVRI
jgi:hypothetical protein